ncbi:MAG TPA: sulfotransferase [Bacteroidales bacterium]|nr:sulfotransferase [Bacteroidales bacterium]HRX98021.1 sulfotransferase [Bacteroidales bacterium]
MKGKKLDPSIKRIFIVGVARSGTTLLQSMLGSHSQVFTMPEMHFWDHVIYKQPILQVFQIISKKKINSTIAKLNKLNPSQETKSPRYFYSKINYSAWVLKNVDQIAQHNGKKIWLEKTPLNLYYTSLISKTDPFAIFIHMLRNPIQNIASLYEAGIKHPNYFSQNTLEACISRYNREVSMSISQLENKNHHFVRYEKLISNPEEVLRSLCSEIKIKFEDAMLNYSNTAEKIIESKEAWKTKNTREISDSQKFREVFKEHEINRILEETKSIVLPD